MSFQHAIRALAKTLAAHSGQSVVYRRGATEKSITARKGRMSPEEAESLGISLTARPVDWLIERCELRRAIGQTEPLPGDTITETDQDTDQTYTFEAMPINSEPCWRYSDTDRELIRIHMQQTNLA